MICGPGISDRKLVLFSDCTAPISLAERSGMLRACGVLLGYPQRINTTFFLLLELSDCAWRCAISRFRSLCAAAGSVSRSRTLAQQRSKGARTGSRRLSLMADVALCYSVEFRCETTMQGLVSQSSIVAITANVPSQGWYHSCYSMENNRAWPIKAHER